MKSRIYINDAVKNQDKEVMAADQYFPCIIVINGYDKAALFTRSQIRVAIDRARKNPEDIPKESFIRKFFRKLING